jgi:aspartyl-tRNA(Asn)/glutamyl-tRNA(Gln) amidotransferase subunit A
MSGALGEHSLIEIASLIRRKQVSSVEVTRACLERIEHWQPRINCFIAVDADDALKEARRLDRELVKRGPRGPLHGVVISQKDVFYRKGKVCSAGSEIRRNWVAPYSATVIERLQAAGAICLGRLNTAEFAGDPAGHNKHFGACRNPWNPAHITGGSSSGSGAAVAARLVYGALGTCTGGSVRLPAAANGVVGLTPTYGRVSRYGVVPRAWSLDHVGPLTRTALDCARLARVIAGRDSNDGSSLTERVPNFETAARRGIKGLRIGVPANHFYDTVTDDVRKALSHSLRVFRSLGAKIVRLKVPDPAPYYVLNDLITKCEGAVIHGKWLRERPQDYSEYLRARLEGGLHIPAARYIEALTLRGPALAEFLDGVMSKIDVLHCPVIPIPVPTLDDMDPSGADPKALEKTGRLPALTRIFNYLGVPSLAVPCGFADNGLPVSFQVVARPLDEARLFAVAHAYQGVTDWHQQMPPGPHS